VLAPNSVTGAEGRISGGTLGRGASLSEVRLLVRKRVDPLGNRCLTKKQGKSAFDGKV